MKKLPTWATAAIAGSGWLVALGMGILDFPARFNSFVEEVPKARTTLSESLFLNRSLTGKWSTENMALVDYGDEPPVGEGGPVWLELHTYRGRTTGEIVTDGLADHWIYSRVLVSGRERGGVIHAEVYDFRSKQPVVLARVEITEDRDHDGLLKMTVIEQGPLKFVPDNVVLYPHFEELPDGEFNDAMLNEVGAALLRNR